MSEDKLTAALANARVASGESLAELSTGRPLLLVFLRHFGCVFCRQAVNDVATRRSEIEAKGAQIVYVHQGPAEDAEAFFIKYGDPGAMNVADPDHHLYQAFGLQRGSFGQVMGMAAVVRGTAAMFRFGASKPTSDPMQLPGAFVVQDSKILSEFRPPRSSDRTDYLGMVKRATALG